MAAWATDELIARIEASGKRVEVLTVGELLGWVRNLETINCRRAAGAP